jgi:hypothetical protein
MLAPTELRNRLWNQRTKEMKREKGAILARESWHGLEVGLQHPDARCTETENQIEEVETRCKAKQGTGTQRNFGLDLGARRRAQTPVNGNWKSKPVTVRSLSWNKPRFHRDNPCAQTKVVEILRQSTGGDLLHAQKN